MTLDEGASLPVVDPDIEPELLPYWEGARQERLLLPSCPVCGAVWWVPRTFCTEHPADGCAWLGASGHGIVYSFTRVHKGEGAFTAASPYILAYVELDEGPRILTNIVSDGDDLEIGSSVHAVFDHRSAAGSIVRFALDPVARTT